MQHLGFKEQQTTFFFFFFRRSQFLFLISENYVMKPVRNKRDIKRQNHNCYAYLTVRCFIAISCPRANAVNTAQWCHRAQRSACKSKSSLCLSTWPWGPSSHSLCFFVFKGCSCCKMTVESFLKNLPTCCSTHGRYSYRVRGNPKQLRNKWRAK